MADNSHAALELLAWCGGEVRRLQLATGTAVRYHSGKPPVTIRWVVARDPKRRFDSKRCFRRTGNCRPVTYEKARPTFADALAQVRRALWRQLGSWLSEAVVDKQKPTPVLFEHFAKLPGNIAKAGCRELKRLTRSARTK